MLRVSATSEEWEKLIGLWAAGRITAKVWDGYRTVRGQGGECFCPLRALGFSPEDDDAKISSFIEGYDERADGVAEQLCEIDGWDDADETCELEVMGHRPFITSALSSLLAHGFAPEGYDDAQIQRDADRIEASVAALLASD